MNMFVTEEDLALRIAAHSLGRLKVTSFDGSKQLYDLVGDEMEPNMPMFWGYCPEHGAYFISESVFASMRSLVLAMEHHRRTNNRSHAEAVVFTFAQRIKDKQRLITTLCEYYGALQLWLEHGEETPLLRDISATMKILRGYAPLTTC